MSRPAVVLDRDGTLIREAWYLDSLERLTFFPYSIDAVRLLNRAGFAVVVATNQSGVARGLIEESFVHETHAHMTDRLAAGGARVDGYYYCPHHPEAVHEEYRVACECRKPAAGMLKAAARDLDLDLARSFIVGDRWHDLEAGVDVGTRGILVRTGYGSANEASPSARVKPAAICDNLIAAVSWILRQQ